VAASGPFACPKCGREQARSNQCVACGVFFHKLPPSAADIEELPSAEPVADADPTSEDTADGDREDSLQPRALAAASIAALVGALIWYFVAVGFEREFGLIAWAIGGGVGFAAAALGSHGRNAGIACALLVIASILGGKYLAIDTFKEQLVQAVMGVESEELRAFYDEEMADAAAIGGVSDEASLRRYMVDHEYTQAYDPADVTQAELDEFNEYSRPRLDHFAVAPPTFKDWSEGLVEQFGDLSTGAMLMDSFGLLDILFLFFGVGTAFRLGSGQMAGDG